MTIKLANEPCNIVTGFLAYTNEWYVKCLKLHTNIYNMLQRSQKTPMSEMYELMSDLVN